MIYPLLEFDEEETALIEPSKTIPRLDEMPERCVLCFFNEAVTSLADTRLICNQVSEMGEHPVWGVRLGDTDVAVCNPGVGAPLAAGMLEELIARGCRKFVACGGAGSLTVGSEVGALVVVNSAVRDEGTSYHYLPASREVEADPVGLAALVRVLERSGVAHRLGKSWTTDAIYRETRKRIARRRQEGCLTVEMEASALMAVARFRKVVFGQLLYCGDDVSGLEWDPRGWNRRGELRRQVLELALQAVLEL